MVRFRTLAALAFSPLLLVAQEPVLFAQNLDLRFQQWRFGQSTESDVHGTYDFTVGLPVITYRLGALALTGAFSYEKVTVRDDAFQINASDSTFGLSSAGVRLNLFPYRPFQVRLDYTRTKTPGLMGAENVRGDILGMGLGYRGRYVQDVGLSFRRSTLRQGSAKEDWDTLTLNGIQRFGSTEVILLAQRQNFEASIYVPAWQNTHTILRTETLFSPKWLLRTTETVQNLPGNRWMDGDATLQGYSGPWTNLTILGYRGTRAKDYHSNAGSIGESLAWKHGSWVLHGTTAFSRMQDALGRNTQNASLIAGLNARLGPSWTFISSIATSSIGGNSLAGPGIRGSTSYQIGFVRGGDLPDLVRHSLYLISDWSFDRWRNEVYPPGYLPGELADQLVQRRLKQNGQLGFSVDLGHTSERGGNGVQDWARIAGNISAGSNLRMLVLGDVRRDDGFIMRGVRTKNTAFTGNASYSLSRFSLTATLGLTRNEQEGGPSEALQQGSSSIQGSMLGSTRFEAAGLNLRLWKMPAGLLWTKLDPGNGPSSQALSAHLDFDYRLISFRVSYDEGKQEGGPRSRRIMVSLHRFFDTVALR